MDLLCIDELRYIELDKHGAELLFQVLTEREEKASVAIASNESFGFDEIMRTTLATATVDRVLPHAHVVTTTGDSHRLSEALSGNGVVALGQ